MPIPQKKKRPVSSYMVQQTKVRNQNRQQAISKHFKQNFREIRMKEIREMPEPEPPM